MATRQYYSAKATAEASTTATSFQDFVTLSFTPDDNQDYLMVWSALVRNPSNITTDTMALVIDNSSATLWAQNIAAKDTANYQPVFGQARATFATATGAHTFRLQYSQETATGAISNIKDGNLIAIKLATCDFFQGSTTESFTTATVETIYTTATTLSFTPSATGNYLVIGSGVPVFGLTNRAFWYKLSGGGTATDYGFAGLSAPQFNAESWGTAVRLGLTATQWDFSIQHTTSTLGNQGRLRSPCISAIRLDQFATDYYAETRTQSTVTSTSFATQVSLTQTPTAHDHLVIGGGIFGAQTTANDAIAKFTEGGSTLVEANEEMNESVIDQDALRLLAFEVRTLAASSTTWTVEYTNETASISANASEAFISIINLDTTGGGGGSTTNLSFSVSAVGLAKLVKEPRLSLSARASGAALIVRLMLLNQIATGAGTATISILRVILVALDATGRATAAMTKSVRLNLAATVRGTATVVKTALLALAATARGAPTVTRLASLALAATGAGAATVAVLGASAIVAAAVGAGVAAMSMIVYKLLAASGTGQPAVTVAETVAERVVARLTGQAGLGLYLKAKRSWKRRRSNWKPRGIQN